MNESEKKKWLFVPGPNPGARLRLICFHFAGGAASIYRLWPNGLPPEVEVIALQLPGREARLSEPLIGDLKEALTPVAEVLRSFTDAPYVFYGHSMGGLLGFELIRRFLKEGVPAPRHFFVSGRRAPHLPCRFPDLHDLSEDDLLKAVRDYGGTPEAVLREPDMMQILLPIIRADFRILETYSYEEGPPLPVPISVYGAPNDIRANREELQGWEKHTTDFRGLKEFPGEHFFIQTHRDEVLEVLRRDLESIMSAL